MVTGSTEISIDQSGSIASDYVFFCYELGEGVYGGTPSGLIFNDSSLNSGLNAGKEGYTFFSGVNVTSSSPDSVLSLANLPAMEELFADNFNALGGGNSSNWNPIDRIAFQLAVWEITYESSGTFDLTGGAFTGISNTSPTWDPRVNMRAQGLLDSLDGRYNGAGKLIALISPDLQNQISYVPEPSVLGLQALFVVGLLFRRRRRQ